MSKEDDFLKYFINETLYRVDEKVMDKNQPEESAQNQNVASEEPKNEILIVFGNASDTALPTEDMEYLNKILAAVGRSTVEVDFCNIFEGRSAQSMIHPYILAFVSHDRMPVDFPKKSYVPARLGHSQWIVADALNDIAVSTDLRKRLWSALQQVFT